MFGFDLHAWLHEKHPLQLILQVKNETTILYYLYSTIANLVQNAVRVIPLGQSAGQRILLAFQEELTIATEYGEISMAVNTNDIYTKEDAKCLVANGVIGKSFFVSER